MNKLNQTAEVLLFSAEWSGSCALIRSMVKKIVDAYAGRVLFREIDVDQYDECARQYGITRIPVLLFIGNGQVRDSLTGIVAEPEISAKIDRLLEEDGEKAEVRS